MKKKTSKQLTISISHKIEKDLQQAWFINMITPLTRYETLLQIDNFNSVNSYECQIIFVL